nr:hypothetical protein [Tanacetum cinerariifolium]
STPQESKGVNNDNVIAIGMFRINPSKTSREEKHVPNTVRASNRTKPITVSQPLVITKTDVNSDLNGLSSTGVDNTKTRRPQPRSNTKNDRVPSVSKTDDSLAKHKALELEIERLLKAVVSQDIMIIVQNESVVDTSDLQTELERTKERFENCIIKKETEYAKLWNGVNNDKVIAPEKHVPNTVRASARTKPITVSQPPVFTRKDVNSNLNGLSSIGVDNTKTKRPQPRSNIKNDRVPSASKSSQSKNKEAKVEEHHRNLLLSKNNKHMSSACNNIKTDSQEVISNVACAMCSLQNELQSNIYKNAKLRMQLFKKVS